MITEHVSFHGTQKKINAYLARPDDGKPHPAIIIIHEIWGLNPHIEDIAERFAQQGYVAFAPHLFSADEELNELLSITNTSMTLMFLQTLPPEKRGDSVFIMKEISKLPEGKRRLIQNVTERLYGGMPKELLVEQATKAVEYLNNQSFVQRNKIGSLGFCFGGGISGLLACHTKIAACVVFYGENPSPLELIEKISCPVLGIYGGEDVRLNSSLDKLVSAMAQYKKDFRMKIYPGAPHAFFNDTNKVTYNAEASNDAWEECLRFFKYSFSKAA